MSSSPSMQDKQPSSVAGDDDEQRQQQEEQQDGGAAAGATAAGDEEMQPTYFVEKQEVVDIVRFLIARLPAVAAEAKAAAHAVVVPPDGEIAAKIARFEKVVGQYQELSQLLKPHLDDFAVPLINLFAEMLPDPASLALGNPETAPSTTSTTQEGGSTTDPASGAALALTVENKLGQEFEEYEIDAPRTIWHNVARLVCFVCKVVGFKSVISYFPHDVRMLERCFHALQHWMRTAGRRPEWEVRYGLLLWLANLVLVPFALNNIDSSAETGSLSSSLLECALTFLGDSSKCREGAALFIGRLLTRPDAEAHRSRLMREAIVEMNTLASTGVSSHVRAGGVLHAAAIAFKTGKREELVGFARMLIPLVAPVTLRSGDARVCKTATKLLQRLGLALLPNRPQPWRYNKARTAFLGQQHLVAAASSTSASSEAGAAGAETASKAATTSSSGEDAAGADGEEALSLAHLQQVEQVVDVLLRALGHADTMVRYSAAKGIGRICERLPRDCADDIVNAIFDEEHGPFSVRENDSNWHGATLAVAEICRRYALLPSRFSQVVPLVQRALQYDVCKGSYSVGSHVRDAASYICWAAARSYNLEDLVDYVTPLSRALVTTALTDREVNVRRAASAAFQECAGRLGNFPHALDIITTVDFFALANLRHALLEVAPKIAWIAEYRDALFERLLTDRIEYWSKEVREISAAALGTLCNYMGGSEAARRKLVAEEVVPRLCKQALESGSVNVRHGSVAALAEIVGRFDPAIDPACLGPAAAGTSSHSAQPAAAPRAAAAAAEHYCKSLGPTLINLLPHLEAKRLFRGRGAEYLRQVCCKLIENISNASSASSSVVIALPDKIQRPGLRGPEDVSMRATVQAFFEETCKNPLRWLQRDGASAMAAFGRQFYTSYNNTFHSALVGRLVASAAVGAGRTPNERRGACLMLGALPAAVLVATSVPKVEAPASAPPSSSSADASASTVTASNSAASNSGSGGGFPPGPYNIFDRAVEVLVKAAVAPSSQTQQQQQPPTPTTTAAGVKLPASVAAQLPQSSAAAEGDDAECREEAVRALGRCCVTVLQAGGAAGVALFAAKRDAAIEPAFLAAAEDYATDRRGDIGLFVRLASIESQRDVVQAALAVVAAASNPQQQQQGLCITAGFVARFVCSCLKQSMEKIDRVRTVATKQLHQFVMSPSVSQPAQQQQQDAACEEMKTPVPRTLSDALRKTLSSSESSQQQLVADFTRLVEVFSAINAEEHDWAVPTAAYDLVVPNLACCPTFLPAIVEGLCASVGCLTPHVTQSALSSMVAATKAFGAPVQSAIAAAFLGGGGGGIFAKYGASERMAVPVLLTVERALEVAVVTDAELLAAAVGQCAATMRCFAKDIGRTLSLVPVLGSLARRCAQHSSGNSSGAASSAAAVSSATAQPATADFEAARVQCWQVLVTLLASRFPKVRALCSVELFTTLAALPSSSSSSSSSSSNNSSGGIDEAQQLLSATQWDVVGAHAELKSGVRAKLFELLRLEQLPEAVATELEATAGGAGGGKQKKAVSELALYKTLVAEKGF